jgi:hypothetical protein
MPRSMAWTIKVVNGWKCHDHVTGISVVQADADNDPALTISSYFKNDPITFSEMRDAIESAANEGAMFTKVRIGDFQGYYTNFTRHEEDGEIAWRVWCVFCKDVHLHLTYNCQFKRRGKNDAVIDEMLRTLFCMRKNLSKN